MENLPVDLIECGRCGGRVADMDMETDPRWGEVCDVCNAELMEQNGVYDY